MQDKYNKQIPQEALKIIEQLEEAGYEAYIVGGCVRDLLMNRKPHDWDITTSAMPQQVKKVFQRTYDTGIQHGTVTVILEKEHYEVTTYRTESVYKDCRHPEKVEFVENINLDLARRDFTMNAIAYHPQKGFVDPYGGQEDIKAKIIRCVRDPEERFNEDALRILRAVRFEAQLGFKIAKETQEGIKKCKEKLIHISKERIRDEFLKIILSDRVEEIHRLYEMNLLEYIVPEFIEAYQTPQNHPHHIYNVAEHTVVAMANIEPTKVLRLAAFLHDIGKPKTHTVDQKGIDHFYNHSRVSVQIAKEVLARLRLDNNLIQQVISLVQHHDDGIKTKVTTIAIKKLMNEIGEPLFNELLKLQEADARAQNPDKLEDKLEKLKQSRALKDEILNRGECYTLKDLKINGSDLLKWHIAEGKQVGIFLNKALEYVMENPEQNDYDLLKQYCLKLKAQENH